MLLRTFEVFESTLSVTEIVSDENKTDWREMLEINQYFMLWNYILLNQFILFVLNEYAKDASWNIWKKGFKIQNLEFRLNSRKEFNRPPFWLGEKKWFEFCYHVHKNYLLESITGPRVAQLKYDAVWSENFWETNPKFSKCGDSGQLLARYRKPKT